MTERRDGTVAVLSRHWGRAHDEAGFAIRGVAAAISRLASVEVLVPGPAGAPKPDGAFDTTPIGGSSSPADWPEPDACRWPVQTLSVAITETDDAAAATLVRHHLPETPVVTVGEGANSGPGKALEATDAAPVHSLDLGVPAGRPTRRHVGLQVPVNPLAASRPHVGLGFDDYLLVLSDRASTGAPDDAPTPLAGWLAARFADRHVVVLEEAVASVWRWRSLRGAIRVDTRMDVWRLMAHSRAVVDLAPGRLIARECIEALRFGVPIIVPSSATSAARLARNGGGLWFADTAELLGCVEALDDVVLRDALGQQGQALADEWYGDGLRFAERMGTALGGWLA